MAPSSSSSSSSSSPGSSPEDDSPCPFCRIGHRFPPYDPKTPPEALHPSISSTRTFPNPETFIILATDSVVAFLDIMPLAEGHLLLCPRQHREKLSAITAAEAGELGRWLRVLSTALMRAIGVDDWNVVQNNGAAAAQVVPHTHFHIIPRPDIRRQGRWNEKFTMFGRGQRTDLDEAEGAKLAAEVRQRVADVLREEDEKNQDKGAKL